MKSEKQDKMGFLTEFKEFISRGNVIDLAVGVIIGGAFTAIVNSFVQGILTPFFGWLMNGVDLSDYSYALSADSAIAYGSFLQSILNFLLIGFVVFLMVKAINAFRRKKRDEAPPPTPPADAEQIALLTEIRDLLKDK